MRGPGNPTTVAGLEFTNGRASNLACTVRRGHIAVEWDGRKVIDWRGDFKRLSLKVPETERNEAIQAGGLFLHAWKDTYRVGKLTLTPLPPEVTDDTSSRPPADKTGSIQALELVRKFGDSEKYVCDVEFDPDSRHVYALSADKLLRIWDAETGDLVPTCERYRSWPAGGVAVSPAGSLAATSHNDGIIRLFDTDSAQVVHTLTGHTAEVRDATFSRDGRHLLSGSNDKTIRVWDVRTGDELVKVEKGFPVSCVALSPDGRYFVSPAGNGFALWEAATGKFQRQTGWTSQLSRIAYSPNGNYILTVSNQESKELTRDKDRFLSLWDAQKLSFVRNVKCGMKRIVSAVFSADSRMIVSGNADKTIRVWDVETGREVARHQADKRYTNHVAVSADGRYIVCGGGRYLRNGIAMDDGDHALRLFRMPTLDEPPAAAESVEAETSPVP
jgi:WD40 repeat protein